MELHGLDFSPSLAFQLDLWHAHGLLISSSSSSCSFFLVVSFGHCKFCLFSSSVSLLLQATIGGSASEFGAIALGDRVFRFSITSNLVGHCIYKLRSFECSLYKLFFHLWNNGGPNWQPEWKSSGLKKRDLGSLLRNQKAPQMYQGLILTNRPFLGSMPSPSEFQYSIVCSLLLLCLAFTLVPLFLTGWNFLASKIGLRQFIRPQPRFLVQFMCLFVRTIGAKVSCIIQILDTSQGLCQSILL